MPSRDLHRLRCVFAACLPVPLAYGVADGRAAEQRTRPPSAAGLSPQDAAAAMTAPAGFAIKLLAEEPDVRQPIAMCFDDRGRLWVVECYAYPHKVPAAEARDRILIFEDTDGDHVLDARKVFAEGLNLASGIAVGFGGVWVGAAPDLLFFPDADADADDVPDGPPRILLDGWGAHDTHETLNSFIWGPDGWLYGCHGVFTHSAVGKPGTAAADRVKINAGIWRYHPVRHEFEVFSEGTSNPWGVDFNDLGHAFQTACVIPHLYHVIPGGRYQRQAGQHFNPFTFDDIKTIARHARRLLQERAAAGRLNSDTPRLLREELTAATTASQKLRFIWALHGTGQLDDAGLMQLLDDPESAVRGWAIQLAAERKNVSPPLLERFAALAAEDPSPVVRLALASALQRISPAGRWPIATALVAHAEDAADHNLPLMNWYAIEPLVPLDPARSVELAAASRIPLVSRFMIRRLAFEPAGYDALVDQLAVAGTAMRTWMLEEIVVALAARGRMAAPPAWQRGWEFLSADPDEGVRRLARLVAVRFGDPRVLPQPADSRQAAIATLVSRPAWTLALLDAIAAERVPRGDLSAFTVGQIARSNDKQVLDALQKVWGTVRATPTDRQGEFARWRYELGAAAMKNADLSHGRTTYAKTCGACHQLHGEGGLIGPELTGSNRADLEYLLANLLDPSAIVGRDYQTTIVVTDDGRSIAGIVVQQTPTSVTLQTPTEQVTVPRDEIETRVLAPQSLMPENQLAQLAPEAARDLIAYLRHPTQVPLPIEQSPSHPNTPAPGAAP